jgi:hypothetical protein
VNRLSVLVICLCVYQTAVHAFSTGAGPTFFNATDDVISIEIMYSQGSGFRGDLGPGEPLGWAFAWQVKTIKVRLKGGGSLGVSEAQAVRLRGKLTKPGSQVWVIDGSRICVVESQRFKATKGFHCPVSH